LQHVADYDAYVRRLENLKARPDTTEEALAKAETKVRLAGNALNDAKLSVAHTLSQLEDERAILARDTAFTLLGAQVHFHRHATDVLSPLLTQFPEAAMVLAELAQHTHVAAATARPRTFLVPSGSNLANSATTALHVPLGLCFPPELKLATDEAPALSLSMATAPFATLHQSALPPTARYAVAHAELQAAGTKAATSHLVPGGMGAADVTRALSAKPSAYARAADFKSFQLIPDMWTVHEDTEAADPLRQRTSKEYVAPAGELAEQQSQAHVGKGFVHTYSQAELLDPTIVASDVATLPSGRIATVRFDFQSSNPDELPLRRGQVIEILERTADGWWTGRLLFDVLDSGSDAHGHVAGSQAASTFGLFPYNYVTVLAEQEAQRILDRISLHASRRRGSSCVSTPPLASSSPTFSALGRPVSRLLPPPASKKPTAEARHQAAISSLSSVRLQADKMVTPQMPHVLSGQVDQQSCSGAAEAILCGAGSEGVDDTFAKLCMCAPDFEERIMHERSASAEPLPIRADELGQPRSPPTPPEPDQCGFAEGDFTHRSVPSIFTSSWDADADLDNG
jgi:hypothetical protein